MQYRLGSDRGATVLSCVVLQWRITVMNWDRIDLLFVLPVYYQYGPWCTDLKSCAAFRVAALWGNTGPLWPPGDSSTPTLGKFLLASGRCTNPTGCWSTRRWDTLRLCFKRDIRKRGTLTNCRYFDYGHRTSWEQLWKVSALWWTSHAVKTLFVNVFLLFSFF